MRSSNMPATFAPGFENRYMAAFGKLLGWPLFLVIVVVPSLVYMVYVGAIASRSYRSEFRIQIRSNNDNMMPNFGSMLGLVGSAAHSSSNGYAVVQYLESPDAVRDLDAQAGLRQAYSRDDIDYLSRLTQPAIEDVTRYWKRHVEAYYDSTTDTLVVSVSAYRATDALRLSQAAKALSEHLLNQMSERSRRDAVDYAQRDVDAADAHLRDIEGTLLKLRNSSQTIDPAKQLAVSLGRVSKLQELTDQAQADLVMRRRYLAAAAPGLQLAEARLRTLQASLSVAQNEVAGQKQPVGGSLATTTYRFEEMEGQKVFAEKRLQAALTGLTTAQADAARQQLYLNTIVSPYLAQEPTGPRPMRDIPIFFGVAFALWLLVSMLLHSVRDHIIG